MKTSLKDSHDDTARARKLTLKAKFALHMLSFSVLLGMSMGVIDKWTVQAPVEPSVLLLAVGLALLPLLPFFIAIRCVVQHIRQADELEKKIALDAALCALAFITVLSIFLGLLELNHVIQPIPLLVFPALLLCTWALCHVGLKKYYC